MSDPKPSEATTGEPSAEAREAARKAWNDAWRAPVSNGMGGYNVGTDRKDVAAGIIALALDAFAARAVERERERLRAMLPPEVFDCGAYYNALDALVADLRVLCPDCFDATGGSDAG